MVLRTTQQVVRVLPSVGLEVVVQEHNFCTETFYAWTDSPGTDGSNKTLSSRNGFAYWNTGGGYRTSADWHVRDSYNGGRRASVSKNGITTGEENMHTGNEYGFITGHI